MLLHRIEATVEKTLSGHFYFSNHFSNADESWRTVANASERKLFDYRTY
jgi:hypothetical protein